MDNPIKDEEGTCSIEEFQKMIQEGELELVGITDEKGKTEMFPEKFNQEK